MRLGDDDRMMPTRARVVVASAIAVTAAVAGAILHFSTRPTAAPRAPASASNRTNEAPPVAIAGCRFHAGDQAGFAISSQASAAGNVGLDASDRFDGVLRTHVIEAVRPGEWLVGAAIVMASLRQGLTVAELRVGQSIDTPFLYRIDAACRIVGIGTQRSWKVPSRRFVSSVLRSLEIVAPPAGAGRTYMTNQQDALGPHGAIYQVGDDATGGLLLRRRKTGYGEASGAPFGLHVEIVASDTTATLDRDGAWLRSFNGRESVRIEAHGQTLTDVTATTRVERNDAAGALVWPPPAFSPDDYDWSDPFAQALEPTAAPPPVDWRLVAMSLADALAELARLYSRDPEKPDSYRAALFLADWLKLHPEQAAAVLGAIRELKLSSGQRAAAFLALERCGTDQARTALVEGLRDKRLTALDRARAATALSDVPRPTADALRALVAEAQRVPSAGDADSVMVAATSVRALGHLGGRTEKTEPALHGDVRAELSRMLTSAPTDARAIDVLDAVGNSGDEALADLVKGKLASESPIVREHAARAFRQMDAATARDVLQGALATETDPAVRAALADTLAAVTSGQQSPSDVSSAATALANEPDPTARAALIRLLGPAAATSPAAKQALIDEFHREKLVDLQRLVGKYLSVEDLR